MCVCSAHNLPQQLGLKAAVYSIRALPMHAFERRRPHQLHPFRDFGHLPGSCSDHPRHRHAFHPYRWQQNLRQPALYAAPRRCAWSAPHFSTLSPTTRSSKNAVDIRAALNDYSAILEQHANVVLPADDEQQAYWCLTERRDGDIFFTTIRADHCQHQGRRPGDLQRSTLCAPGCRLCSHCD